MDDIDQQSFPLQKSAGSQALGAMRGLDKPAQEVKQGPSSQGGNVLGNSFRSDGSKGFARMSSDDFDRASDEDVSNQNPATANAGDAGDQIKPILATAENTKCYSNFENHPVRIEGPEFNRDFTYYLVDKMQDLKNLE